MVQLLHMFSIICTLLHSSIDVVVNMSARCSSNSEAFVSELLEHLEEMFPRYQQYHDI